MAREIRSSHPCLEFMRNYYKLCIALFLPIVLLPLPIMTTIEGRGLYVLIIMAVFWITEAIPLAVTSLLPLVLGPTLGIKKAKDISPNYFKDVIVLFAGGLMVALCIEKWKLHKRMALAVLLVFGTSKRWLLLGIMLPTWFLSMWISNTATAAMMVPIVAAIMEEFPTSDTVQPKTEDGNINGDEKIKMATDVDSIDLELNQVQDEDLETTKDDTTKLSDSEFTNVRKGMFLCVAYAAACGGIGTLTGTPPNIVLAGVVESTYGTDAGISFQSWMGFGFPLSVVSLLIVWLWMCIYFFGFRSTFLGCGCQSSDEGKVRKVIRDQFKALGPMTWPEGVSLVLFLLLVALWLTRSSQYFTGWGALIGNGSFVSDSTSAMFIALLMMILPAQLPRFPGKKYVPMLDWFYVGQNFPWAIILLLGGGYALADICQASGITTVIINQLSGLKGIPTGVIILIISAMMASVTEIASNTAMATLVLPLMADLAVELEVHPLYLMLPVAISCSFAFMLPTATPPNAVVFAHGSVTVFDMIKVGFVLNILCLLVLQLAVHTIGVAIFDLHTFPDWANRTVSGNSTL